MSKADRTERACSKNAVANAERPIDIVLSAVGPNETEITFRDFDRSSELFEVAKGGLLPTASLDDVIRMKEAADRGQGSIIWRCRNCGGCAAINPERSPDVDPFVEYDIDED